MARAARRRWVQALVGLGAIVAILLVALGFAQLFIAHGHSAANVSATTTIPTPPTLTWKQRTAALSKGHEFSGITTVGFRRRRQQYGVSVRSSN